MRRYVAVTFVIVVAALAQHAALLQACGEKLLVLGRSIRFQSRHTPRAASVLLYVPQSTSGRLADPNLESALTEAGHGVRAVTTAADLERALTAESYDVVLTNITEAPGIERVRAVIDRHAVVLPAVYLVSPSSQSAKVQTKADRDNASKTFGVVVEVPGRPGHYCAAVDKAMELKLKRERASTRRP